MKVLLVCESSHKFESGGRVVRYLSKILKSFNYTVKILVLSKERDDKSLDSFYEENDVVFLPFRKRIYWRYGHEFALTEEIVNYKALLKSFGPDVVHFASFDSSKPSTLIKYAKQMGAKILLQPWTMHFFCAQGFGFRNDKKCNLCAEGNFFQALHKGCINIKGIPSQIERRFLQKAAFQADVVLSSNEELDKILLRYGICESKIARFPVPFDYTFIQPENKPTKQTAIFFGQPNAHKGLNVLTEVYNSLRNLKLEIYPMKALPANTFKNDNVKVILNINWQNGLAEALASSEIALAPSLWSSSTEYSLCESILFKKPVVVFNTGVHKHLFKDGYNARVIEVNDIAGYGQAIVELSSDKKLRDLLSENAYQTLVEFNNPEKVHSQWLDAVNRSTR